MGTVDWGYFYFSFRWSFHWNTTGTANIPAAYPRQIGDSSLNITSFPLFTAYNCCSLALCSLLFFCLLYVLVFIWLPLFCPDALTLFACSVLNFLLKDLDKSFYCFTKRLSCWCHDLFQLATCNSLLRSANTHLTTALHFFRKRLHEIFLRFKCFNNFFLYLIWKTH